MEILLPYIIVLSTLMASVDVGGATRRKTKTINFREKEKEILDQIIGSDRYDSRIRPAGLINDTSGLTPTTVRINLFVRQVERIDDYKMEYSVQITFREDWKDPRLEYYEILQRYNDYQGKLKYLTMTETNRVWMPDTFFQNEKMGHFHSIIVPNVYIRIYPEGRVLYSIRISLTLACPMDLKLYPLDRQQCEMRIASYGWTTADLIYKWKEKDPVQVVPDLNLPRFKLERYSTDYCNSITNTGEYSCLKVRLVFKREFSYYLLTIYVPSCMLVIVSWVSFWLDSKSVPARVSLGVTTLLTMSTQTAGVNRSLPPVAYTKAIDVWSNACVFFVFSALMEFAFVNYAAREDRRRGYIGRDYGEDDDDIDYTKGLDEDITGIKDIMERKPSGNTKYRSIGESIILGAASAALTGDRNRPNIPQLVKHPSQLQHSATCQSNQNQNPPTRITTNHFEINNGFDMDVNNLNLQDCIENSMASSSLRSLKSIKKRSFNPSFWLSQKFKSRAKRIDICARMIFPMVFAIFNTTYWTYYLSVQSYEK